MKRIGNKIIIYILLIIFAMIFFLPVFWMLSTSFKPADEVFVIPLKLLPTKFHPENYVEVWSSHNFFRYFLNSGFVASAVTLSNLFFCALAGYSLAKFNFPGKKTFFLFILSTLMVPYQVIVIPLYIIVRSFGLLDSYWGLIIPNMISAFGVFLLRQNIIAVPNELIDAARIDGCSEFGIFLRIILPLARPGLVTLGILTFLMSWNDLLWPLLVVQSDSLQTLMLALARLSQGEYGIKYNLLMSGSVIASIPVILIFLFLQRYFIKAAMISGLKG